MRSLFKLTLLAAGVLALSLGSAWAQDAALKIGYAGIGVFATVDDASKSEFQVGTSGTPAIRDAKDTLKTASSKYYTDYQVDVLLTGTAGPVTLRSDIRFRDGGSGGNEAAPATNRTNLEWQVNDMFRVSWLMRSNAWDFSLVHYSNGGTTTLCTAGCVIGDASSGPVGFFTDRHGMDFRASFGTMKAGLILLDDCVPGCGATPNTGVTAGTGTAFAKLTSSGNGQGATKDTSAQVLYFMGVFGPATVSAYTVDSSGKVTAAIDSSDPNNLGANNMPTLGSLGNGAIDNKSNTIKDADVTATSGVSDVLAAFDFGMGKVSLESASITQSCNKTILNGFPNPTVTVLATCSALTTDIMGVGLILNAGPGRVEAHVYSNAAKQTWKDNKTTADSTFVYKKNIDETAVSYVIPVNANFTVGPIYATRDTVTKGTLSVNDPTVVADTVLKISQSQSYLGFGGKAAF